jgi:uncharacterized protein YggL (DUF469 family)
MKRLFISRLDKLNPGDYWSTPKHYFDEFKNDEWVDVFEFGKKNLASYDKIIVGGGGLLFNSNFDKALSLLQHSKYIEKVLFWGVGVNSVFDKDSSQEQIDEAVGKFPYKLKVFNKFQLNLRDKQERYNVLPCASCLHPVFDTKEKIVRKYLAIKHTKINSFKNRPLYDEIHKIYTIDNTIENVIAEIKRSEIVVTQSYHGAYWAALCNKKVIVLTPWSTKFLYFDFPVKILSPKSMKWFGDKLLKKIAIPEQNYLKHCREKNLKLYESLSSNNA